ncbi:hypothetical protein BT63DRAFT_145049 [Microthyrium microscopicum]|uniref:Uncharacterized protein n=1 Tax=Microthyrium microscopicum TaxID=703497 RepID=A0A6A6UPK7_9PEZI|nr:hypothetical protein BT63DRAFT_145049 [Microthyrium microscopicum]
MLPEVAMILLALLLNIFLTMILDGINYIPATALRWALRREGHLDLNSNPRIFSSTKSFAPTSWTVNIFSGIALVMAYGGTSVLTYQVYVQGLANNHSQLISTDVSGERYGIDFNSWGFIGLGIGIVIQSAIASWTLVEARHMIVTWNANPIGTARACYMMVQRDENNHNQLHYDAAGIAFSQPSNIQPSMSNYTPLVRSIANIVWTIAAIICVWTAIVGIIAHKSGTTTSEFVEYNAGNNDALSYWQLYGQVGIKFTHDAYLKRRDWLGLIIQCLVLSIITLGLHFVECVCHVWRDEAIWRKAATVGVNPNRGAVLEGIANWPCCVLFFFKTFIHWIFGYAFSTDVFAFMTLLPMVTLAVCFILLVVFVEFLIRWRPRGYQPVTYGDIERLIAFIDEWDHERIFWGDKGELRKGFRKAGTTGHRLGDLVPDKWYRNLRGNS